MGRTIHIAFISQIILEAAKIANIVYTLSFCQSLSAKQSACSFGNGFHQVVYRLFKSKITIIINV